MMSEVYKDAYEDLLKDLRNLRHTVILETCQKDFKKLITMIDDMLRKEIESLDQTKY